MERYLLDPRQGGAQDPVSRTPTEMFLCCGLYVNLNCYFGAAESVPSVPTRDVERLC